MTTTNSAARLALEVLFEIWHSPKFKDQPGANVTVCGLGALLDEARKHPRLAPEPPATRSADAWCPAGCQKFGDAGWHHVAECPKSQKPAAPPAVPPMPKPVAYREDRRAQGRGMELIHAFRGPGSDREGLFLESDVEPLHTRCVELSAQVERLEQQLAERDDEIASLGVQLGQRGDGQLIGWCEWEPQGGGPALEPAFCPSDTPGAFPVYAAAAGQGEAARWETWQSGYGWCLASEDEFNAYTGKKRALYAAPPAPEPQAPDAEPSR